MALELKQAREAISLLQVKLEEERNAHGETQEKLQKILFTLGAIVHECSNVQNNK